jgi:hypothetical protein
MTGMKQNYLAVLDNNETPRAIILPLVSDDEDEIRQVAEDNGFDLDKCEWMAGEMEIGINI